MIMNRKEEYLELLEALESAPPALERVVSRARARTKSLRKARIFVPATSAALFFIVFVALVNLSQTFAMACGRIPLIRELAEAVSFSPSLSAAVENEFVQPIELEQTVNGVTMRVENVIVDQKQLNIFYSLKSDIYESMDGTPAIKSPDGSPLEGYALSSSVMGENGGLRRIVADFVSVDVPGSLLLGLRVIDNGSRPEPIETQQYPEDPESVAEFEFLLTFDSNYTQQGETIELNQDFVIDGQKLRAVSVEIYPTHMSLNLEDDENNTAWLKSLEFHVQNEKGERFEVISNGITGTGKSGSKMIQSHRLESAFFSKSEKLVIQIQEAVWLDKSMEKVLVDLVNGTADALPEGVSIDFVAKKPDGWKLGFSGREREESHSYQLFYLEYYDEFGNRYEYNRWSTGMTYYFDEELGKHVETPGVFHIMFDLDDYPYDAVYLSPSFSRVSALDKQVEIRVK
jgi:hypothetical protein